MMKPFLRKIKAHKVSVLIGVSVILVMILMWLWYENREQITMENDSVVVDVFGELDQDISHYLQGMKNPEDAQANWDMVNMEKIGIYDVTISYHDREYILHVDVRDREKPKITLSKDTLTFTLDTSVEEINQAINECMSIHDNYDQTFADLIVVNEVPKEAQEVDYPIRIKDLSGNESDEVTIKVIYEETAQNEVVQAPVQNKPQESTSQGGNQGSTAQGGNQGNTNSGSSGGSEYDNNKPIAPEGAIEATFSTQEEALAWMEIADDPNSEWYMAVGFAKRLPNGMWWAYLEKNQ